MSLEVKAINNIAGKGTLLDKFYKSAVKDSLTVAYKIFYITTLERAMFQNKYSH